VNIQTAECVAENPQSFAETLCDTIAAHLIELRHQAHTNNWKPARLGKTADKTAHDMITAAIRQADPAAVVLSEEAADDRNTRRHTEQLWIIDPVDGTWEYQSGRPNWSVHIALWDNIAQRFAAAAITTPDMPAGGDRPSGSGPVIVRSATGTQHVADQVAQTLHATLIREPSAGAKVRAVLSRTADAYIGKAGIAEWDLAAPIGVALAHGFRCTDHNGNQLTFNRDSRLPAFVIATPELHERIIDQTRALEKQW
jgi:3'(2'), 5'-bisphosphate nucleotidase